MKYIIVELQDRFDSNVGREFPIVFPEQLSHCSVARIHCVGQQVLKSAGFCLYDPKQGWVAMGRSESTGFASRPQDSKVLNDCLELTYTIIPHEKE